MKNLEVSHQKKCTELWLPSFKVEGIQTTADPFIRDFKGYTFQKDGDTANKLSLSECKQVYMIETSKGLPQKEGLINSATDPNPGRCIIDKPFLFGKHFMLIMSPNHLNTQSFIIVLSDAELEESMHNLPLLVA
jgi:hypothetical protein